MVRQQRFSRGPEGKTGGRPRYVPSRKVCAFCAGKVTTIDYKEPEKLTSFISEGGRISSRGRTGTCARHQRILAQAIKRARHLALLPYVPAHIRKSGFVIMNPRFAAGPAYGQGARPFATTPAPAQPVAMAPKPSAAPPPPAPPATAAPNPG